MHHFADTIYNNPGLKDLQNFNIIYNGIAILASFGAFYLAYKEYYHPQVANTKYLDDKTTEQIEGKR